VPVVDYLEEYAAESGLHLHRVVIKGDRCPMYDLTTGRGCSDNPVRTALHRYTLISNKHIPQVYKANSRRVRLELLAGLIDADGTLTGSGYDVVLKSERLASDLVFLARSLGFAAYRKACSKACCNTGAEGIHHRVSISGDLSIVPVRIPRKRALPRRQKEDVRVTGIRVEDIGIGAYYGFEIDGDRLFLLGDFTVTHNTTISQFMLNAWRGEKSLAVAHITNPSVRTPSQFLRMLLSSYGAEPPHLLSDNWDALRSLLVGNYRDGKTTVAVIDEAQTISAENMETLTHISNEQTQKHKLIQIILLAQPNIVRKLTYKPALRDRIAHGSTLNPLTYEDAVAMLHHRISVAGGEFDRLFPAEDQVRRIYNATKGIPRRLCMLCDNALLNAYALRKKAVDEEAIADALTDLAFKGWKDKS
jgi:type II secretory pathway predicted ATPase ExeA